MLREMAMVIPIPPHPDWSIQSPRGVGKFIEEEKKIPRIAGPFEKGRSHLLDIKMCKTIVTTPELLQEWRPGPRSVVGT